MKIAIGSDHAGYKLKEEIKRHLENKGFKVQDFGCSSEESVDYPDFAHPLSKSVAEGESKMGVLMCGSGNGINMTANKHKKIRAALCWLPEIAALARQHNNANILTLPARYISIEEGKRIVDAFLLEEFEGGRHERRVGKISC